MFLLISILALCLYIAWYIFDSQSRPPGPLRLPLLGNLLQIASKDTKYSFIAFHKLAKTYGGIMRLQLGLQETIIISDFHTMQEMMIKENFLGRFVAEFQRSRALGEAEDIGIVFSSGDLWRKVRQFTIKNLREFGFGKKDAMESKIHEELAAYTDYFKKNITENNGVIRMDNSFHLSLMNVLWSMVAAKSFSHDDPRLIDLLRRNEEFLRSGDFGASVLMSFPFSIKLFPGISGYAKLMTAFYSIVDYLKETISEHKNDQEFYSQKPNNFIEAFLKEIQSTSNNNASVFTEKQLLVTLMDLFNVGSETTANTLAYAILHLIRNPQVQQRMYEEIHSVAVQGEPIKLSDAKYLPYTAAVIYEVLRISNVVTLPPPRKPMEDSYYNGFFFPKGCPIICNMYSVTMDNEFWTDPEVFRPERFLGPEEQVKPLKDRVNFVFGFGKRICPGENLAQASIFLYLTTLLRNFKFQRHGQTDPTTLPTSGYVLAPQPFDAIVLSRTQET